MARRSFKLNCHRFISSFRFCRPKHLLTFSGNPKLKQSPANSEAHPYPLLTPLHFFNSLQSPEVTTVLCNCKFKSRTPEFCPKPLKNTKKNSRKIENKSKCYGDENQRSAPKTWRSKNKSKDTKKAKQKLCKPIAESLLNGYEGEEDEETEDLITYSTSFSDDFRQKKTDPVQNSNEISEVRESLVVVKRSKQPKEEFKRSMAQMILEEEIYEAQGLEELLKCYLRLNSPQYHQVIVEAFSQVWAFLFCDSRVVYDYSSRNSTN